MGWESLKEDTTVKDVKDLMTQAIRALKAGRKEEAYRLFSEVVELQPTNEDALLGKAGCSSDLDETILLLQKILAINPSNERAREGLEWARARKVKVRPEAPSVAPPKEGMPPARQRFGEALPGKERQLQPGVDEPMPAPPKERRFSRFWIGLGLLAFLIACGVVLIVAVSMSSRLPLPMTSIGEIRASPVTKPPMPSELKTYMQVIMESIGGFQAVLDKRYEFETREECLAAYEDQYAPLLLKAAAMYYGSERTALSPEDVGEGVPTEAIAIHEKLVATYESFSGPLSELCLQVYNDSRGLEAIVGPNPSAAERRWWETRYDSIDASWLLTIASLEEIKTELNDLFSPYEEGRLFEAFVGGTTRESPVAKTPAPVLTPTPMRYPALGWETIYDPHSTSSVDYPADKWQLDDRTLSHLSIPGCTLDVFSGGTEVPFEWEMREYDVPVRLGEHPFLRRTWAVSSTAAPRLVAYRLDESGRDVLFHLLGSPALDDKPNDFAVCQEDAEAVIATLTID